MSDQKSTAVTGSPDGDLVVSELLASFDSLLNSTRKLDVMVSSASDKEKAKIVAYLENRLAGKLLEKKFKTIKLSELLKRSIDSVQEIQEILLGLAPLPKITDSDKD